MTSDTREKIVEELRLLSADVARATIVGSGRVDMGRHADRILALVHEDREPVAETLYAMRCGWCGAYEGTVDPAEPCARDSNTGEYIGPHQFGVVEHFPGPLYASSTPTTEDAP